MLAIVSIIRGTVDFIDNVIKAVCVCFILGIFFVIVGQVILRYFLIPVMWAEEVVRYMAILLGFLGGTVAFKAGSHIAVDIVMERLSPRARFWVSCIGNAVILISLAIITLYGVRLAILNPAHSPILKLKLFYLLLAIPLSGFLMIVYSIARLTQFWVINRFGAKKCGE